MKRLLLATTVLLSGVGCSLASDLPAKAAPYAVTPAWSWSGFYIGGLAGYGWGSFDNTVAGVGPSDPSVALNNHASGGLLGVYAGYNYMLWDRLLIGIETDYAWTNIRGGGEFGGKLDIGLPGTIPWAAQANNRLSWLGTTRARVGYAFGGFLPFVAGGVAYGHIESDGIGVLGSSSIHSNFAVPFSGGATKTGWTVGTGFDYAITNNLIARVEYLYFDLGTASWSVPNTNNQVKVVTDANGNLVRAGLSYKF